MGLAKRLWEQERREEAQAAPEARRERLVEVMEYAETHAGVGTHLKRIFGKMMIKGCGRCKNYAAELDAKGVPWCEENMDEIVQNISSNSQEQAMTAFLATTASALGVREKSIKYFVELAIKRAKADQAERGLPESWPEPTTRHLLYHLGAGPGKNYVWQQNVERLLRYMPLFNGSRIIAILSGYGYEPAWKVERWFRGHNVEFLRFENDKSLREVVSLLPMWEMVQTDDPTHATFYCQAKGVTRDVNPGVTVHRWTEIMYEANLGYWDRAREVLKKYPLAGAFKKVGRGFRGSDSRWHYSGTFYWLRNAALAGRNWRRVDHQWWGAESWPSLVFSADEAGCVFHEGTVPQLDLYSPGYMQGVMIPDYEEWAANGVASH